MLVNILWSILKPFSLVISILLLVSNKSLLTSKALAISLSGADKPTEEVLNLANDYIEGRKELEEIKEIVINKYKEVD